MSAGIPVPIANRDTDTTTPTYSGGFSSHSSNDRSMSLWDDTDRAAFMVDPSTYVYPFENLVFEGGGNKALAYSGAIQCLEEMNILTQIRRVGGSSAGATTACLVAMGYTSEEIRQLMSEDAEKVMLDHACGCLSFLPNVLRRWGWNPGNKIYQWLGDKIKAKTSTNSPDLTFFELFQEKGVELCVVVTNLNHMRTEYCHPKTTPDMPIREALLMSMSIPGVFMARRYNSHGQTDTYVDGGVLCNYPIHCFDGWYLSMAKEDAFLLRLQNLNDMPRKWSAKSTFDILNIKTLGFLLYDDCEREFMRFSLEQRIGSAAPEKPARSTRLYREQVRKQKIRRDFEREHSRCLKAAESLVKALYKHNLNGQIVINKEMLKQALEDESCFSREDRELLFGSNMSADDAFKTIDKDGNGQIAFHELLHFLEIKGIRMQSRMYGYDRMEIDNLLQFVCALQKAWLINVKRVYAVDADVDRTVGINTGHIGTSSYRLEEEDRDFLAQRGYSATKSFLKYFVVSNPKAVTRRVSQETTSAEWLSTNNEDTKL